MEKCLNLMLGVVCAVWSSVHAQTTFNYTGAVQAYTVPACVSSITVDMRGAEGGTYNSSIAIGGKGGRLQATLRVTPGEVLNIYVGGAGIAGTPGSGGWNGGGNPGPTGIAADPGTGGGGGGASDIRQGGNELSNRIAVASGGGGASGVWETSLNSDGGDGGGIRGKNGLFSGSYNADWCGSGGTDTAGGKGSNLNGSQAGEEGLGGQGGREGGGGGAGYYGGGGGSYGGGGGGSSYADPLLAVNVIHTPGFQTGNGQIMITPGPSGLIADAGPDTSLCRGESVALGASGGANYSWSPVEGLSCTDCQSPVASPSVTTTYTVTVTSGTCEPDSDSVLVTVNDCGETGIKKLSDESELSIFPNPAADVLHLQFHSTIRNPIKIELLNAMGQSAYSGHAHAGHLQQVDISSLPAGVYYLMVRNEDVFAVRKIMIQ